MHLRSINYRRQHTILVDGNRFAAYGKIPHRCIIKGDGLYASIAASILAKTYRDEFMLKRTSITRNMVGITTRVMQRKNTAR
jgi:ribonuclease HII